MEQIPLTPRVAVLRGAICCGVVQGRGGKAVVIDTGIGERAGRRILEALHAQGLEPVAVLNTHAHGDHTGGNAFLAASGARIYAPEYETTVIRKPEWGILCLFGGAQPPWELRTRRLNPPPAPVHATIREGTMRLAGTRIKAIHLPGHTGGHMGYLVDGILFLGDLLAGEEELARSIPCVYSVSEKLQSLERLENLTADWYVGAHFPPRRDIKGLIRGNRRAMGRVFNLIDDAVADGPTETGEIVQYVCREYGHIPSRVSEFFMVQSTILSHLSHLHNLGELTCTTEDGRLLWSRPS